VEPHRCPKPEERRCLQHGIAFNIFCETCQSLCCLLCTEEHGSHSGHHILSLTQATELLKSILEDSLKQLESDQVAVAEAVNSHQRTLADIEQAVVERRSAINEQCDSLVNEVEIKREFFLSDLEYEVRSKTDCLMQHIEGWRQQGSSLETLIQYTRDVLCEADPCAFVQLAKTVNDKVAKNLQKMAPLPATASSAIRLVPKVVDFRKEKAIIRSLAYLTVPDTPHIDVPKCSRSTSSVVLVLCAPNQDGDVVDGYRVFYSIDQQRPVDSWDVVDFKTPGETRRCGRGSQADSAVCLMHNNLSSGTVYYFAVIAYNTFGCSEMSEIIHCHTLSASQSTVPVPTIVENQSRTYTYSIQLHSPSPLNSPPHSTGIEHYLLFREASVNKIWKSISLYGRVDHRVFGLEPDTLYDFVVMACDKNSECQVSKMVTMKTERSAY
jgi:hypothetical protein